MSVHNLYILKDAMPYPVFDSIFEDAFLKKYPSCAKPTSLERLRNSKLSKWILNEPSDATDYGVRKKNYQWAQFLDFCYITGRTDPDASVTRIILQSFYNGKIKKVCDHHSRYQNRYLESLNQLRLLIKKARKKAGVGFKIEDVIYNMAYQQVMVKPS